MDIRTSRLSSPPMRSYTERIRSHQESANKAESIAEHKERKASHLALEWDEANGVYSLGGRRITFSCEVYEYDYETISDAGDKTDHAGSSFVNETGEDLS